MNTWKSEFIHRRGAECAEERGEEFIGLFSAFLCALCDSAVKRFLGALSRYLMSAENWNINAEFPRKFNCADSTGVNCQPRLGTNPGEKPL